jgi:hypothetical protein
MPKQKDLKRLVRTRMKKTRESYTAARRHVLRSPESPSPTSAAPDYTGLAGMADETIRTKTGRSWAEWVRALDAIGADRLPHGEIARHVSETYEISGWWSQAVTVGYERIRGLREIGQRRSGAYEASKSKTLPVSAVVAFDALANARVRKRWLPDVSPTIRKASPPKSVRMTWPDGTDVTAWITAKGDKCSVAIQHSKLTSKVEIAKRKAFWAERLSVLAEVVARSPRSRA